MTAHPAYQAITVLGEFVVSHILNRVAAEPDRWFVALHAITGASPVEPSDRGNIAAMQAA